MFTDSPDNLIDNSFNEERIFHTFEFIASSGFRLTDVQKRAVREMLHYDISSRVKDPRRIARWLDDNARNTISRYRGLPKFS